MKSRLLGTRRIGVLRGLHPRALILAMLFAAVGALFPAVSYASGFDYPVSPPYVTQENDGDGYYNAQDFGVFNSTFGKYHLGEDWNGEDGGNTDLGDPVYAVSNGTVAYAGFYSDSWGNLITIHHTLPAGEYGGTVESMYAHLDTILVSNGATVSKGQLIGTIGNSGTSTGGIAHLHFELRSDEKIGASTGYSVAPRPAGWLDPSDFIDSHRTSSLCNQLGPNQEVPPGYGASYNVFKTSEMLVSVLCNGSNSITVTAGNNDPYTYIYKEGYSYDAANQRWVNFTYSCPNTLVANAWCVGEVSKTLSLPTTGTNHLVSYTCQWRNNTWKCGCSDTTCLTSKWQLQIYGR